MHDDITRRHFLSTTAAIGVAALSSRAAVAGPQKQWRIGVIGHTGRGNYGHGLHTMWLALPETEIVGLADADDSGRDKTQRQLGDVPAFADYRQMLAEIKPEIVAVAPRHVDLHRDMVVAAAEAGARGIYCEKPFCRTPAEADDSVAACRQSGTRLAIAHRNRFHPALPQVREAVGQGAIGQLLEIRGRGKEDTRGGGLDLWVLGSHVLDLARYFAGDAVSCSALFFDGNRPVTPDDVRQGAEGVGPLAGNRMHARYEMTAGIPVYFDSIREAGVREANFGLQLVGNKGLIDLRIDVEPLAHFVPGNPFLPTSEARPWIPITSAGIGKPEPIADLKKQVANHMLAARDLIAAISEDRPSQCSETDGRAIVEMIHAAFASHVQQGEQVDLPLASREHPFEAWSES